MMREELKRLLPHREPMLLLDEVRLEGEEAHGSYTVRGDEFFLQGHFPGRPVVPGVILCEMLAQTACVLLGGGLKEGQLPVYTGLDHVRFRTPVRPGDKVETCCALTKARGAFYFAKGKVTVDGKLCAEAEFSFAVAEV